MFIPEITTTVSVEADTKDLEESINLMQSNEIMSECFTDIIEYLEGKLEETNELVDPTAEAVAESLSAYQSAIIKTKHYATGMMANSVDVMKDGEGVYLVGNTATSVDGFPYPLAIETGRREVYPINAKALRWFDGGDYGSPIFAKKSSAVKEDPFVDYSIQNLQDAIEEIVNPIINKVWSD